MTPCIESSNNKNADGYPRITHLGRIHNEHRIVYLKSKGTTLEAMSGKVVMHSCDNRNCINPDHLILGTQKQNCQDKLAKGRPNGGGARKALTSEQVAAIRADCVTDQYVLAKKYNVSQPTINNVKRYKGRYSAT